MLTSKDSAQQAKVTSRATGRTEVKPVVVDKYNQSLCTTLLQGDLKNGGEKYVFREIATVYAYILHKTSNSTHTHLQFRRADIESLTRLHLQEAPE